MRPGYYLFALLFSSLFSSAQNNLTSNYIGAIGTEDWTKNWTSFVPNGNHYMQHTVSIPRFIDKDLTLKNDHTYLLSGTVYVTNQATLTIEPGTVIKGDHETCGTLVITRGSKIIAAGTERDPIVFTSAKEVGERRAGDWGGIILLGNATTNFIGGVNAIDWGLNTQYTQYGGNDDNDNSGMLNYVRIEYPGNKLKIDEEFNGLTLAGVGKNTTIEHVQVSYSNDDSFELYGGTVGLNKIISYKCSDDDFDFNYGYQGVIKSGIALRNPLIGDFSGSRCFEIDSYNADKKGYDPNKKETVIKSYNFTLIQYDINGNNQTMFASEAIQIGADSELSIFNSVVSGFNNIFKIKDPQYKEHIIQKNTQIENNLFNGFQTLFIGNNANEISIYFEDEKFKNSFVNFDTKDIFNNITEKIYPDFKFKNPKPNVVSQ